MMAKKELIANDPMETRLMAFAETVRKISGLIMPAMFIAGALIGAFAAVHETFTVFLLVLIPCVIAVAAVWLIREAVCHWLEYMAEMHCYARTQTEILMDRSEKD